MKRLIFSLSLFLLLLNPSVAHAIYSPLSVPNNRVGVHVLDTSELIEAAKLVNSTGGDWGYVTIPMRSNDRDREKWRAFFDQCKALHLIPIVRLTTYVYSDTWVTPTSYDLVDFANFLNEMPWPIKNRYIILFNEPNHAKEWGGQVDPSHYATMLIQAKDIFKSRSEDFFLLSAGLDMSAPSSRTSQDALLFYRLMTITHPQWHQAVDGLSFHAYPNPGFQAPVLSKTRYGIQSYTYELNLLSSLKIPPKPIFITETGTVTQNANFFSQAFNEVWIDNKIVAITPFLLFAGGGDFVPFSLLNSSNQPTASYDAIFNLTKTPGSPLLSSTLTLPDQKIAIGQPPLPAPIVLFLDRVNTIFKHHSPTVKIAGTTVTVEVADDPVSRTRGLSGRSPFPDDHGMFFIFPSAQNLSFWMLDMRFALDFIWIRDGQVVDLHQNIPPPSQTNNVPQTVKPSVPANQVLEVNAGFIARHGIKVGDEVDFRP